MPLSGPTCAVLAAVSLAAGALALARGWKDIRETTLIPAWWWTLAAVVSWSLVEMAAGVLGVKADAGWLAPGRFAVVVFSFCPVVAILGAKRPQHAAWSFVVLAFWGITALPAAETFFLQRGQQLEIGDARSWFLWLLILLGPINFGLTRRWLGAALAAAGQFLALSDYLPLVHRELFAGQQALGLVLYALALAIVRSGRPPAGSPYDRLWRDFRDQFGLFWALRLQERVNSVATTENWPAELAWGGFVERTTGNPLPAIDPAIELTLRTTIKGLLRRFVSNAWIAERLGRDRE